MLKGLSENHSSVIQNFSKLTEIPRCSGEEKAISDFLYNWAKERNLEVYQDKMLNIVIKKEASKGMENHEPVLLQGHMDMVCEVKKGHEFDFACQEIEAEIQGDLLIAPNTTLGADNGIAVAMIMTLFEDLDAIHPPLEALITVDEERGMTGAIHLEGKYIDARKLINIDSEEEGVCCVGCAGGQRNTVTFDKKLLESSKENFCSIAIEGLKGGHSGQDIHEGRANANQLLARLLYELKNEIDFELSDFIGGSKSNAIPRDAQATIAIAKNEVEKLEDFLHNWEKILKKEYSYTDPDLTLVRKDEVAGKVVSKEVRDRFLGYLLLAPNGVWTMSKQVPGQVESSTNLGVVSSDELKWEITSQVRSSMESKIFEISRRNEIAASVLGGKFLTGDSYPAWEYEPNSELRDKASEVWREFKGEELVVETIHAGLECGLLQDVLGKMDMISIGPDMSGVHAPGENVSIQSTDRVYEYLKLLLKQL